MSSADLSLDISRLVSRALGGEDVDSGAAGAALAAKYPDLGMPGDLISSAIDRAAGMARMALRPATEPGAKPHDHIIDAAAEHPSAALNGGPAVASPPLSDKIAFGTSDAADTSYHEADLVGSLEAALAAAVESGFADRFDDRSSPIVGHDASRDAQIQMRGEAAQGRTPRAAAALLSRGPVAAMRRAFFGS